MADDSVRLADTRSWLDKAAQDLRAARHGMLASPPLIEDVLFHCQQTVEKALKALLAWNDVPFRKTHSLEELGEACVTLNSALKPLIDRAVPMTEYAWRFRYPGDDEEPSSATVEEALATASAVWKSVATQLPVESSGQGVDEANRERDQ